METTRADRYCGLSCADIQELQLRGHSIAEIASMCGGKDYGLTTFMSERRATLTLEPDEQPPAPDLSRPDKIIVYRTTIAPGGSSRRIYRVSLPAISMHVDAIEGRPCA